MSIAVGIALIVLGAILTFALKGGHIGSLDLHAVGVILMLAGIIGILLPMLIRNLGRDAPFLTVTRQRTPRSACAPQDRPPVARHRLGEGPLGGSAEPAPPGLDGAGIRGSVRCRSW